MTSRKTVIPAHWISALFAKFQIIFGSKWAGQIEGLENEFIEEWQKGLKNLKGYQIKTGLDACRLLEWPPSMGKFITLCKGEGINNEAYKTYSALPKPKPDKAIASKSIQEMRKSLEECLDE